MSSLGEIYYIYNAVCISLKIIKKTTEKLLPNDEDIKKHIVSNIDCIIRGINVLRTRELAASLNLLKIAINAIKLEMTIGQSIKTDLETVRNLSLLAFHTVESPSDKITATKIQIIASILLFNGEQQYMALNIQSAIKQLFMEKSVREIAQTERCGYVCFSLSSLPFLREKRLSSLENMRELFSHCYHIIMRGLEQKDIMNDDLDKIKRILFWEHFTASDICSILSTKNNKFIFGTKTGELQIVKETRNGSLYIKHSEKISSKPIECTVGLDNGLVWSNDGIVHRLHDSSCKILGTIPCKQNDRICAISGSDVVIFLRHTTPGYCLYDQNIKMYRCYEGGFDEIKVFMIPITTSRARVLHDVCYLKNIVITLHHVYGYVKRYINIIASQISIIHINSKKIINVQYINDEILEVQPTPTGNLIAKARQAIYLLAPGSSDKQWTVTKIFQLKYISSIFYDLGPTRVIADGTVVTTYDYWIILIKQVKTNNGTEFKIEKIKMASSNLDVVDGLSSQRIIALDGLFGEATICGTKFIPSFDREMLNIPKSHSYPINDTTMSYKFFNIAK